MRVTDGEEEPKTAAPAISLLLAYAALVPIVLGTLATLALGRKRVPATTRLTVA